MESNDFLYKLSSPLPLRKINKLSILDLSYLKIENVYIRPEKDGEFSHGPICLLLPNVSNIRRDNVVRFIQANAWLDNIRWIFILNKAGVVIKKFHLYELFKRYIFLE